MEAKHSTVSPLRQRMIEDMRMRKFGEKTQSLRPLPRSRQSLCFESRHQ